MFSSKGKKRPNPDSISSDFLEGFVNDRSDMELPSFLFNSSVENNIFKTPELNRGHARVSNQSTPLLPMTPSIEQTCTKTPSPDRCMTSTPKQAQPEQIHLNDASERANRPGAASKDIRTLLNERANLFGDSSLQQLSGISKADELRPIGAYTVSQLEEEYERLLTFIKEEREKNVQYVSDIIQSMREHVWHATFLM